MWQFVTLINDCPFYLGLYPSSGPNELISLNVTVASHEYIDIT